MRTLIMAVALVSVPMFSQVARAQGGAPCDGVGDAPLDARTGTPALENHVSIAMCLAEANMNALTLTADDASMAALADAMAPARQALDDIAATGDPRLQVMAAHARGELVLAAAARLRAAIPFQQDAAQFAAQHAALEQKLAPWLAGARQDLAQALAIADANPSLMAGNPVLAAAIAHCRADLSDIPKGAAR